MKNRNVEKKKTPDEQDPELAIYQTKMLNATAALDSIKYRNDYLKRSLLDTLGLDPKDPKRQKTRICYDSDYDKL